MRKLIPLSLLLAACGGGAKPAPAPTPIANGAWPYELPYKHAPAPTTAAITAADLATRLYIIADDSMRGRETGDIGNVMVTNYIASEFRRLGLTPAGDSGTYFQTIPFMQGSMEGTPTLTIGGHALTPWQDYVPLGPIGRAPFLSEVDLTDAPTLYGGRWGDSTIAIDPAKAKGAVLVLRIPVDTAGLPIPGFWNVRDPRVDALQGTIAGIVILTPRVILVPLGNLFRQTRRTMRPDVRNGYAGLALPETGANGTLFPAPIDSVAPGTLGAPLSAKQSYVWRPNPAPSRNVIAILPGSDPVLRDQYVGVSAHNDHIGMLPVGLDHDSLRAANMVLRPIGANTRVRAPTPEEWARISAMIEHARAARGGAIRRDSVNNGAIDDGSGTVILLELAEYFAHAPRLKRSILFISHTGEEKGLLGSQWFTDHPTVPRDSIESVFNMDMPAANHPVGGDPNAPYWIQLIGSRRLSTQLGGVIDSINGSYGRDSLAIDYSYDTHGHPLNRYCRSDHFMYARYGIPITYISLGYSPDYHMASDEPQYVDYPHSEKVATFVRDILVASANRPVRYVVDGVKQDPRLPCRQ